MLNRKQSMSSAGAGSSVKNDQVNVNTAPRRYSDKSKKGFIQVKSGMQLIPSGLCSILQQPSQNMHQNILIFLHTGHKVESQASECFPDYVPFIYRKRVKYKNTFPVQKGRRKSRYVMALPQDDPNSSDRRSLAGVIFHSPNHVYAVSASSVSETFKLFYTEGQQHFVK